jgi:hypothetical protein
VAWNGGRDTGQPDCGGRIPRRGGDGITAN